MTTATLNRDAKSNGLSEKQATGLMRALVFHGPNNIAVEKVPIPKAGYGEVVMRVTLTTICGTDVHTFSRANTRCAPGWSLAMNRWA